MTSGYDTKVKVARRKSLRGHLILNCRDDCVLRWRRKRWRLLRARTLKKQVSCSDAVKGS